MFFCESDHESNFPPASMVRVKNRCVTSGESIKEIWLNSEDKCVTKIAYLDQQCRRQPDGQIKVITTSHFFSKKQSKKR